MQKKRLRRHFENEAKKINKNIEFYRYLKLIDIFEQTTFIVRSY